MQKSSSVLDLTVSTLHDENVPDGVCHGIERLDRVLATQIAQEVL